MQLRPVLAVALILVAGCSTPDTAAPDELAETTMVNEPTTTPGDRDERFIDMFRQILAPVYDDRLGSDDTLREVVIEFGESACVYFESGMPIEAIADRVSSDWVAAGERAGTPAMAPEVQAGFRVMALTAAISGAVNFCPQYREVVEEELGVAGRTDTGTFSSRRGIVEDLWPDSGLGDAAGRAACLEFRVFTDAFWFEEVETPEELTAWQSLIAEIAQQSAVPGLATEAARMLQEAGAVIGLGEICASIGYG